MGKRFLDSHEELSGAYDRIESLRAQLAECQEKLKQIPPPTEREEELERLVEWYEGELERVKLERDELKRAIEGAVAKLLHTAEYGTMSDVVNRILRKEADRLASAVKEA